MATNKYIMPDFQVIEVEFESEILTPVESLVAGLGDDLPEDEEWE